MEQNQEDLNRALEEYKEIQRRRELWSNAIVSRDTLFFPLAIAIFAFFGTQLPHFIKLGIEYYAFVWGGVLLSTLLIVWRGLSLHVDRHIVQMYQDEVKLEKKLKFSSRTKYIYKNLTKRSKKHIADLMGKDSKDIEGWDYEKFSEASKNLGKRAKTYYEDHYDYLIAVLQKFGYCSVGTRGHWIWHLSAVLLILFWVGMALWWVNLR